MYKKASCEMGLEFDPLIGNGIGQSLQLIPFTVKHGLWAEAKCQINSGVHWYKHYTLIGLYTLRNEYRTAVEMQPFQHNYKTFYT